MNRPDSRKIEPIVAIGAPALLFVGGLRSAGLWDPYEMQVAELARRAAVNVFGATNLVIETSDNTLPTLGDLGRNELPITSAALGFKLFGLHDWAGRLPLALWGVLGLIVMWLWLSRMVAPRAATYATLLLGTTPLYFVHARTLLGDIVTMVSMIAAFAGLSIVTFSRRREGESNAVIAAWGALGLAGLVCGFLSRGAWIGVAVPTISIGLSWLLVRGVDRELPARSWVGGPLSIVVGLIAAAWAFVALGRATVMTYEISLGAIAIDAKKHPTFDTVLAHLGHAMFPWSAFIPMAMGRLFSAPPRPNVASTVEGAPSLVSRDERAVLEEIRLRIVLLVGGSLSYVAYALLAPKVGLLPFGGVGLLVAIGALALYDFERGAHPSRALAVITSLLAVLLYLDFSHTPEKAFSAFAVAQTSFPESFRISATRMAAVAMLVFAAPMFLAFLDRDGPLADDAEQNDPDLHPLDRYQAYREVRVIIDDLQRIWNGNLGFFAVMIEAAMVGVAILVFVGERIAWKGVGIQNAMSTTSRVLALNAWWAAPSAAVVGLWIFLSARKLVAAGLVRTGWPRARLALSGGVFAGVLLATGYYPALAGQLSPREVFDVYERKHSDGEPLGLLGVSEKLAAYYSVNGSRTFHDTTQAFAWLTEGPERRWLAVRSEDVRKLNALYRPYATLSGSGPEDHNLPVLDARSSQIQLVSDRLLAGEKNVSELQGLVSSVVPKPAHAYEVNLNDQLMAIGWSLYDEADQRPVELVVPARKYTLHLYYRVTAPITTEWESFVHIDGFGRRFNGDHKLTKYPMTLWQPGDYVTDRFEFQLEPNFSPGNYTLLYGFFIGDTRLTIKGENRATDNRVNGGVFPVR